MSKSKIIGLIFILAAVTGSIWYLEHIKVRPGSTGNNTETVGVAVEPNNIQSASSSLGQSSEKSAATEALKSIAVADRQKGFSPAAEITDPTGFINATPFKLTQLVGKKVILVDFWTYSCINCIRTLPYLTAWYSKYHDQGLEIIGIHTPEFEFEKDLNNVQAAVKKYGIKYPVVLDSNYGIWQAYGNLYWPHEYLVDIAGYVVHDHIGEGDYDATEREIQNLLSERAMALNGKSSPQNSLSLTPLTPDNLSEIGSEETYFGAARNDSLENGAAHQTGNQILQEPPSISSNKLYLVGSWNFTNEYAANQNGGEKIIFKYNAAKVFFVASAPKGAIMEVWRDGVPVSDSAGSDVQKGRVYIQESRLYGLVNDPKGPGEHTLQLIIESPGVQSYTFTFG